MKHLPPHSKQRNQLELLPSSQAVEVPITPDLIDRLRRLPTLGRAWNYAQDVACLENKYVSGEIGMDESQWNKIRKGIFNPPADERFSRYSQVVRNHVLLAWHCESEGFDFLSMRRHQSSMERELEETKKERDDYKRAFELAFGARRNV